MFNLFQTLSLSKITMEDDGKEYRWETGYEKVDALTYVSFYLKLYWGDFWHLLQFFMFPLYWKDEVEVLAFASIDLLIFKKC